MEVQIIACKKNEEFILYQISQLINSNFSKKPHKSHILIPTSPTGPSPVVILLIFAPLVLAPFTLLSLTSNLLTSTLVNIVNYFIYISDTRTIFVVYIQPLSTTLAVYDIQHLETKPIPKTNMQLLNIRFVSIAHLLPSSGSTSLAYI